MTRRGLLIARIAAGVALLVLVAGILAGTIAVAL